MDQSSFIIKENVNEFGLENRIKKYKSVHLSERRGLKCVLQHLTK